MEKDISGRVVLLIWSGMTPPKDIEEIVGKLKEKVGTNGCVNVEHVDRLKLSSHAESTFDVIYSGFTYPTTFIHTMDFLGEVARILKPSGSFHLREPTAKASDIKTEDKLVSTIKLSGFVKISKTTSVNLAEEQLQELKSLLKSNDKDLNLAEVSCEKPSYNVGSSSQLKLSFNRSKETPSDKAAKVWTLTVQDMNDADVDIMDSDDLLDENDYKKPDPASLKSVCGPNSGKKKACKNCTCGLADDLAQGIEGSQPKSACGSCYLGDAFRCASCPYLGMPAFKPGEKISLSDRQLKPDL